MKHITYNTGSPASKTNHMSMYH